MHTLGLLQIDCVNVVCPAHYMAPFSRLGHTTARIRQADLPQRRVRGALGARDLDYPRRDVVAAAIPAGDGSRPALGIRQGAGRARRLCGLGAGRSPAARTAGGRRPATTGGRGWPNSRSVDRKRNRGVLEAHFLRGTLAAALVSPFDPLIWCRPRVERLFGFRYRVEILVPPEKRQYGFYVLPFLLGEKLIARVDLKADRASGGLRVLGNGSKDRRPPL